MTVGELIKILEQFDSETIVTYQGDVDVVKVNSVYEKGGGRVYSPTGHVFTEEKSVRLCNFNLSQ